MIYFFIANFFILLMTTIGSFLILFIKKDNKYKESLYSLSIGIMTSSVIYSLIIKSFDNINNKIINVILILIGSYIMILINKIFSKNEKKFNFTLSMFIHNIPEGLSIGLLYASMKYNIINCATFLSFTLGIGLQNIADGFIVSSVLNKMGESKKKSILIGFLSGVVEPIFSLFGMLLICKCNYILPYMLALSGGICFFVIINDLLSELKNDYKNSFIFILGFSIILLFEYFFE